MNKYTIYCTPDQTCKAIELGAPIENIPMFLYGDNNLPKYVHKNNYNIDVFSYCPTAEQMLNWLEEQGMYFKIFENDVNWSYDVIVKNKTDAIWGGGFTSRKEAILVAIDAALEYLVEHNLIK